MKSMSVNYITMAMYYIHYQITKRHDTVAMVASSLDKIKVSVEMANKQGDEELKLKQEQEEKEKQTC